MVAFILLEEQNKDLEVQQEEVDKRVGDCNCKADDIMILALLYAFSFLFFSFCDKLVMLQTYQMHGIFILWRYLNSIR